MMADAMVKGNARLVPNDSEENEKDKEERRSERTRSILETLADDRIERKRMGTVYTEIRLENETE